MREEPRDQNFRIEVKRLEKDIYEAIPEGSTWAAIIAALGNVMRRMSYDWSHSSVKRWPKEGNYNTDTEGRE